MKQRILIISYLLFGWLACIDAQNKHTKKNDDGLKEKPDDYNIFKSNELKIDMLGMLTIPYPTLAYEKILNKHSLGLTIGNSFGRLTFDRSYFNHEESSEIDYLILPYYRYHFGKSIFRNFFIEANALYFKEIENNSRRNFSPEESTYHSYGFGGAIGLKFIRVDGWLVDLTFGYIRIINRYFNEGFFGNEYPRVAVTFGKRF